MKTKLLFTAILLCICFTASTCFATDIERQIENIATTNEKVTYAKCIVYCNTAVIAIKTEKFTTRSEYEDYTESVKEQIENNFGIDNVIITRSPKIMHELEKLESMSEKERTKYIERLIDMLTNPRPCPSPKTTEK